VSANAIIGAAIFTGRINLSLIVRKSFLSMKHIFTLLGCLAAILLVSILAGPAAWAQTPTWQSAVAIGGDGLSVNATVATATGDVYITGTFSGTVTLGATTLTSVGGINDQDIFVAKWSRINQAFAWAQRAGGSLNDRGTSLAVSGSSVYLGGIYSSSTAAFGPFTLTRTGLRGMFIAKINDTPISYDFAWAQGITGNGDASLRSLVARGNTVYAAGDFSGQYTFGSTTVMANTYGGFVTKLTDNGATASFGWTQATAAGDAALFSALALNGSNVYVAGQLRSPTLTLGTTVLTNPAGSAANIVLARLTDAGPTANWAWAQQAAPTAGAYATSLAINPPNLYLGGIFLPGSIQLGTTSLTNVGAAYSYDVFVAKLTESATGTGAAYNWAVQGSSTADDQLAALAVAGTSVYAVGSFYQRFQLGSTNLQTATTPGNINDIYVAKLTDAGATAQVNWAVAAGGPSNEYVYGLSLAGNSLYLAGTTRTPATFGSIVLTSPSNSYTGYLAALTDPTLTATAPALTAAGITLSPNPAHNRATIQLPAVPGAATATLTILDALGRAVRTQTASTNAKAELNLAGLSPGLYAVRLTAGGSTATQRLVVE
jgi:hypothetical protein